jgi:hypothetical protein
MISRTRLPAPAVSLSCPRWRPRVGVEAARGAQPPWAAPVGLGVRLQQADRRGHRLDRFTVTADAAPRQPDAAGAGTQPVPACGAARAISAAAASRAPLQRVTTREQKRKEAAAAKDKSPAARLGRFGARALKRKLARQGQALPPGRYRTSAGPITISHGWHGQLMTKARKKDYGGQTFGSTPPYAGLKANLPGVKALYTKVKPSAVKKWKERQRLAMALTVGLQHGSENDRAPGLGKVIRALARQHEADPTTPHPLDKSVNPAVSTAQEARDLMSGTRPLNAAQKTAISGYASDSSDDDEPEDQPIRTGMMTKEDEE